MSSSWKKPFQRLWRKVTGAGKVANSSNKKDLNSSNSRNRKGSNHSSTSASVRSTNTSYSLEDGDDEVEKHQRVSPKSSLANDSVFEENGSLDSLADEEDQCESAPSQRNGSLDSLVDEKDHRESVSSDENTFEFFPSNRKDSLILDQILLGINTERKENGVNTPENNHMGKNDEYEDVDAKAIVGATSVRPTSVSSKLDSNSPSSMAVSECSELDINIEANENGVKTPENNHTKADDKDEDVDAKPIAAISGRSNSARSKLDSTSVSSMRMAVSQGSDLDDISLLDTNTGREGNGVKTPQSSQTEADDEDEDVDKKAIVAAILGRPYSANSETDSDSDSSMAVSECSDLDDDSSDEESDHEVFDIEDHINKLAKRENKSDSDNDSYTDGYESVTSEKVSKTAEEIADSAIASTQTSGKGSETEESPITDDSDSEVSDQDEDQRPSSFKLPLKENGKTHEHNLALTLGESRAQDLRWPFSNFYVKELKQDLGMPLSDNKDALPSYKSTVAFANYPGRKRDVIQGRVWCVEWWAKEGLHH